MILTYKLRLRDKHASELNRQARAVNYVWNYCNETQRKAAQSRRQWLSGYDLQKLTTGSAGLLNISSTTICKVCEQYARSRAERRKSWLRWRSRRSLGWIPFGQKAVRFDGEAFVFRNRRYEPMHMRDIPKGLLQKLGSFNADANGHWYINVRVEVAVADSASQGAVGIDLGLKHLATLSDGAKIEAPQFYRASEAILAKAQRRRKTKRARAIHRKIANRRRDFVHKTSAALIGQFGLIVVGDVSPKSLALTSMAKSVNDAGWSSLKHCLSYKSHLRGGKLIEVSENYTTQTCSSCGSLPPERPRGIAGLSKRMWVCSDCGAEHDRDVNAAKNILRVGLHTLSEGARRDGSGQKALEAE